MTYRVRYFRHLKRNWQTALRRALCDGFTRHMALFAIHERHPAGLKLFRFYRCWCDYRHSEEYGSYHSSMPSSETEF